METCVDLFLGSALVEASRGLSAFVENYFAATSMIESACRGPSAFVEVERGNNSGASELGRSFCEWVYKCRTGCADALA